MNFLLLNHAIAIFLTTFTFTVVGILVLIKSRGNKTALALAIWSLSVAGWSFFEGLTIVSHSYSEAFVFARIFWIFVLFIAVSTAHFAILFLEIKGKELFIKIGYILSVFFAVISPFTPLMTSGVKKIAYFNYWPQTGFLIYFNAFIFAIYVIYQFYHLFKTYKTSVGIKHNQIAYILWASALGYTGGLSNYLLMFDVYIPFFHPFATYLLIFYPILVGLAILKYQLVDIKLVIKKGLVYSIIIALISGGIVGVSFLSNWFVVNVPGFKFWAIPLIAGFTAFMVGNIFWKKSKEVDKLKYEFITVAAHKLRTPLTEVRWASSGLEEDIKSGKFDNESGLRMVSGIKSASTRLIELTNELLDIAKTGAGGRQYHLELTDFEKLARREVNDFQRQIHEKGIKLSYDYDKDLPKINIDKTRISIVIQILVENAITYTKDKIDISIKQDRDDILFSIKDNGIGISKEDQPHIFSRFYRTSEAYKTETEGAGIGLYLAKSIIDKHNGRIGVNSEGEGKGSEFWVRLLRMG